MEDFDRSMFAEQSTIFHKVQYYSCRSQDHLSLFSLTAPSTNLPQGVKWEYTSYIEALVRGQFGMSTTRIWSEPYSATTRYLYIRTCVVCLADARRPMFPGLNMILKIIPCNMFGIQKIDCCKHLNSELHVVSNHIVLAMSPGLHIRSILPSGNYPSSAFNTSTLLLQTLKHSNAQTLKHSSLFLAYHLHHARLQRPHHPRRHAVCLHGSTSCHRRHTRIYIHTHRRHARKRH
jgi:hypothetical protein